MNTTKIKIYAPLVLSFVVLFFLLKNETNSGDNKFFSFDFIKKAKSEQIPLEDSRFIQLKSNIEKEQGTYALYIKDISNNKTYQINSDEHFYPLSLFKIPMAYLVAKDVEAGKLSWEDNMQYKQEDYFNEYGTISTSGFGSEFSLSKIVELMLRESDNTAPKILKRYLGEEYLNEEFKKITGNKSSNLFDEYSTTTSEECAQILEGIFFKNWMSTESTDLLLSFMYPTSYDSVLNPLFNERYTFYHKVGIDVGLYHDCGVIKSEDKDLIFCLLSKDITEESLENVARYTSDFVNGL